MLEDGNMEKSTIDQLLNQLAADNNPEISQSILNLLSNEEGSAELLKAYEKEPEKNRGLLEAVLSKGEIGSDNPIIQLILAALQGQAGEQSAGGKPDKEGGPGGLLGEVLESLADNLLDQPKPRRKTRPKSKPKSKPKTSSSTKPKSKTGTKTKSKAKAGAKSKPKSASSTKSKSKTGTKSKPKTTSSTKTKPKSKPKTKTKSMQIDLEE
jgi:hypothetical protein